MKYESNQFPKPIKEAKDNEKVTMKQRLDFVFNNMPEKMPNLYKQLTKKIEL